MSMHTPPVLIIPVDVHSNTDSSILIPKMIQTLFRSTHKDVTYKLRGTFANNQAHFSVLSTVDGDIDPHCFFNITQHGPVPIQQFYMPTHFNTKALQILIYIEPKATRKHNATFAPTHQSKQKTYNTHIQKTNLLCRPPPC